MAIESIVDQKKKLRREMFAKRNNLQGLLKEKYDHEIVERLKQFVLMNQPRTVHVYIPMGSEIDIRPFISSLLQSGITVVSPKTLPHHQLENRILSSLDQLGTGIMGTQHPLEANIYNGSYDLIVVPGLAVDHQQYRLGYGGGYYDTFLAGQSSAKKAGVYYPFQQVKHVPTEPHDIKLDEVIIAGFDEC